MATQDGAIIRGGVLNKHWFRRMMAWPIWGGKWSYLVVETGPGQELECIRAIQTTLNQDRKRTILTSWSEDTPFPASLADMLVALQERYPPEEQDASARTNLDREITEAKAKYRGSDTEFEAERQKRLKVLEWERILKAVPSGAKDILAAWNREERDAIYGEIRGLTFWSPITRWYFNSTINAIVQQEDRWKGRASMGPLERMLFWFWNVLMLLGVIIPDVINFFLHAYLAVIRSLPTRPQGACMALAIMDFPYADERLARLTLFQRFLGALVTIIFGIKAAFDPEFRKTAFKGFKNLWWKALLAVLWQMAMQNWKNVLDFFVKRFIRRNRLTTEQINTIKGLLERLELSNVYNFAWFESYNQGNRFRAQVSNHKQDHEDVSVALRWAARLILRSIPSEDFFSKFFTWCATTLIGVLICASAFPVDPYAGLVALAYYSNIIVKMALDVKTQSQTYGDVLRFFTATVGPTFPATLVLIVNLVWWGVTRVGIFRSFGYPFWITLALLFVVSLFPKWYGETFKRFGLWIRGKLARKNTSSGLALQER